MHRASRTHDRTVPRRKPTQNKHNYVHLVRTCWLAESSLRSLCYRVSTRMVHVRSGTGDQLRTRLWAQANNSAMYSCCSTYLFHISVYNFTKFELYIISSSNLKWRSSPWLPACKLTDASEHAPALELSHDLIREPVRHWQREMLRIVPISGRILQFYLNDNIDKS